MNGERFVVHLDLPRVLLQYGTRTIKVSGSSSYPEIIRNAMLE
jgi:hypothetical protein